MSKYFDQIATGDSLELKSAPVDITLSDGKKIKFTVNELTPIELSQCVDEFNEINTLALVYRSVRDPDGFRMTKEQAAKLDPETLAAFVGAYTKFMDNKKKSTKVTKKKSKS